MMLEKDSERESCLRAGDRDRDERDSGAGVTDHNNPKEEMHAQISHSSLNLYLSVTMNM